MRSLFLKIFLWFWCAMALVAMVLMISTEVTQQSEMVPPERVLMDKALRLHGQLAADMYFREGRAAVEKYLSELKTTGVISSVVLDDMGNPVAGGLASPVEPDWVLQALKSTTPLVAFRILGPRVAMPVSAANGQRFIFVSDLSLSPMRFFKTEPHKLVLRLVAILLTAGLVCYWLARYLTAPVTQLRMATQKLASGDLSARVNLKGRRRDELIGLGHDFNRMAEQIESMMETRRRLLSDISHELRSPLARLSVALGLARQKNHPEVKDVLDRMERETERLNDLIGQILALSRLESEEVVRHFVSVDLSALISEAVADANYEATERNRRVEIIRDSHCILPGRPELLHSSIENVIRNALHYTREGTAVEINLECGNGRNVLVRIRDHGPGVPEASLDKLFEPFYRIDEARNRQAGGAGLGLAITQRAVQLHGGTVRASNAADGGLIVELQFPLQPANNPH